MADLSAMPRRARSAWLASTGRSWHHLEIHRCGVAAHLRSSVERSNAFLYLAATTALLVACSSGDDNEGPPLVRVPGSGSFEPQSPADGGADANAAEPDAATAGFVVSAPSATTTSESGAKVTFTVRLASTPSATVVLPLAVSDPTEAGVSPASLTFTTETWAEPQTVTVIGKDDDVADGDQPFSVLLGPAVSADPAYSKLIGPPVALKNLDNDTPGFAVTPLGTITTEEGGTAKVTVRLTSRPSALVTIPVSTSRPEEAVANVSAIEIAPHAWSDLHEVIVTGVDDGLDDGAQSFSLRLGPAVSSDASYDGRSIPSVPMTNLDRVRDGSSQGRAARTCVTLHAAFPALGSGVYWVNPNGGTTDDAFTATCDMTRDGGGWTLVGRSRFWLSIDDALPAGVDAMLGATRLSLVVAASSNLYRAGSGAQRLFVRDASPAFSLGTPYWRSTGNAVTCTTSYADVALNAMKSASTFQMTCDPHGVGAQSCADDDDVPNGWVLYREGDTYDVSGEHPCSFGVGEAPTGQALLDLWVR
jgi:hypothetical protein